jgi:aprataxin
LRRSTPVQRASLKAAWYEKLLKDDLRSWRTDEVFKTIPKLKEHMQSEWESEAPKAAATGLRKAKRPAPEADADMSGPPQKKIAATS